MSLCILLDKDNKEISKSEWTENFLPRNGWEKRPDGNFYKKEGDERCISDIEAKEKEEAKPIPLIPALPSETNQIGPERDVRAETANALGLRQLPKAYLPSPVCIKSRWIDFRGKKMTTDVFSKYFDYTQCFTIAGTVSMTNVIVRENIPGINEISLGLSFSKVVLDSSTGHAKFWKFDINKRDPDICIMSPIAKTHDN